MPYPLPLTRTEAYLAYKAGVVQLSDLKPSLAIPRNGIDAWLAYWTGLAEDYPKREDGTPHILQEEEAYIAYLSGMIDTYPEKCLRRVGEYLRYLISARWGRPDHPLNREELYLSLIKTQFIPSGDPSSDITIDGTAKAPFVDVKMYGDTFQQTYTGKNLFNAEAIPYVAKRAYGSDGTVLNWSDYTGTDEYQPVEPNTEYALWNNKTSDTTYLCEYDENKNFIQRLVAVQTFTTTSTTKYLRWSLSLGTGAGATPPTQTQLELGSKTSYEPFVGGQPSPNPSYPQDINVVTGTQTISINGTDYPISLGSLELCKLGTYQDYIWKDGEDWKVHKELGNVTLDSTYYNSRYGTNSYGLTQFLVELGASDYYDESGYVTMLSNSFTKQATSFSNTQVQGFLPALDSNSHKLRAWIRISTTTADTTDQFKAWLNTNTPIFYYKLNTATDTTITDTTLITQLDSLVNGGAEDGTTYIKVNATDPNLPAKLYVEAPKYD